MAEQMKPSGIDWIGDIPNEWDIKRIKYLAQLKGRIGWQGLTSDEYTDVGPFLITGVDFSNGGINWENCVHITEERWAEAPEIHIKNGDLLITKDGTVGKVAIVENLQEKASLNSGVLLIKTSNGYNKKFLYWALLSEEFWTWFRLKNAGNSTIVHLYQNDFAEFSYTFPNAEEQQAIADYLDQECAQIDSISADLEKQIELLQQYKKSLITETVTKGLNKSVPMKDSGIDWIGKIPNHYEIIPLKYLFSLYAGGDVDEFDFSDEQNEKQKYPIYSNSLENKGLFGYTSKYRFSGKTFTVTGRGDIGKAIPRFESYYPIVRLLACIPKSNANNEYYSFCVNCADVLGDQTAMSQLTTQKLGAIKVPMPPLKEQKQIVEFLNQKCLIVDQTISIKENQLNKLEQHKKSLIYEYVTGKKRVKEVQ